jgi:hypothetical protein
MEFTRPLPYREGWIKSAKSVFEPRNHLDRRNKHLIGAFATPRIQQPNHFIPQLNLARSHVNQICFLHRLQP